MDWLQVFQSIAALVFVLALIGGVSLLVRRYGNGNVIAGTKDTRLRVIESRTIDAKRRLMVLACDETEYVVLLSGNQDVLLETRPVKKGKS